jgi:GTPase SAR1 family protein
MSTSFKVAMVGPSSVGKTTLLTAILAETQDMLAGTPVTISKEEPTEARVGRNRRELRRAIEAGEFDAGALGSTQSMFLYEVALEPTGDDSMRIPFSVLDYPGRWFNAEARAAVPEAKATWPTCIEHICTSIMLLVPIDSAVLMEAVTPKQKGAVADLLGFEDVEAVAREWAKARNKVTDEPAVLVLAPLKCEKYFDDNGGDGRDAGRLRAKVREK